MNSYRYDKFLLAGRLGISSGLLERARVLPATAMNGRSTIYTTRAPKSALLLLFFICLWARRRSCYESERKCEATWRKFGMRRRCAAIRRGGSDSPATPRRRSGEVRCRPIQNSSAERQLHLVGRWFAMHNPTINKRCSKRNVQSGDLSVRDQARTEARQQSCCSETTSHPCSHGYLPLLRAHF